MAWEPNFQWDDVEVEEGMSLGDFAIIDITALYGCLKGALGAPVVMDDGRQSSTSRRKSKDDTEEATNDGISYQAAKMTKCIVNYMASGADTTVFEQENLLATGASDEMYSPYDPITGESGDTTYFQEITATQEGEYGVLLFAEDDDNLVDLYWEINYMKAPLTTISIGSLPPGSDD